MIDRNTYVYVYQNENKWNVVHASERQIFRCGESSLFTTFITLPLVSPTALYFQFYEYLGRRCDKSGEGEGGWLVQRDTTQVERVWIFLIDIAID